MKPMEEILLPNTTNSTSNNNNNNNNNNHLSKPSSSSSSFERRVRPQKAAAVNCPRCDSTNTKFCYYNNYSLSQPRYYCKTCRRYWTEGGTLRNIPVGGGSRKNKRSSSSSSSFSSSSFSSVDGESKRFPDLVVPSASSAVLSQNPRIHHVQYGQDLNLGFPSNFKNASEFLQVPNFDATKNPNSSALDLSNGITSRGTTNSFMPILISDQNSAYTNPPGQLMIPLPEFKIPSISFSLDGIGNGDGGAYVNNLHESNSERILFPFEELKTDTSTTHDDDHDQGGQSNDQNCDSNGFWNGMMGGGSW